MEIHFFSEDIIFPDLDHNTYSRWIVECAEIEEQSIAFLNYIFCSDNFLLELNKSHLDHDYFTDILTFEYNHPGGPIEGDVFISLERVKENALEHKTSFEGELRRVMIHGLLHLAGYSDSTTEEKKEIREREDKLCQLFEKIP